jgi:hypothetical protein
VIQPGGFAVPRRTDGMAIASLVTGLTSLVCCGLGTGIPAIILGLLSRNRITRSSGALGGGGMATGGVILGFAGSVIWVFIAAFGIYTFTQIANHAPTRAAIPCDQLEHTTVHYHLALQIFEGGKEVPIPTNVGRPGFCYYWIHMHAGSPDVIHIEAPDGRSFTLGDFFDVWAASSRQPVRLDSRHVGTIALTAGQTLAVFVDGHRYGADPAGIALLPHTVIQIEISPPTLDPPPPFVFPPGF